MQTTTTNDGVTLCYEVTGEGAPIIFVHEFAGDMRSWEPQVRRFSGSYKTDDSKCRSARNDRQTWGYKSSR